MKTFNFKFPTHTQKARKIYVQQGNERTITLNLDSDLYDATCYKGGRNVEFLQDLGAAVGKQFKQAKAIQFEFDETLVEELGALNIVQWLSFGLILAFYNYRHKPTACISTTLPEIEFESDDETLQARFAQAKVLAQAQWISRELMNLPSNVLYPESFVDAVKALPMPAVQFDVLDEKRLQAEKFGGLLCISQGSAREGRVLVMNYQAPNATKTVALAGKGVTFDTGGISIKAARLMSTMKFDMGGAAAVVGAMYAIAKLQLPVNVIGLCGLVENMPSSTAIKPGDVVMMRSQTSVEIISTDAEGRMVLADVLDYAQEKYQPDYLVDIATLTGGAGVALGKGYAALMGNDLPFITHIQQAGESCAERVWHMPTGEWFNNPLECAYADLCHGSEDPHGSPCVAATFLQHFVKPEQKWAHLDIAAMAHDLPHRHIYGNTASGFGALLLTQLCQAVSKE
ncbi:MAG: leucyl aminopeptidase family protein [Pasteurellaceae bacterium]|nr:leucyl aminopeptidase family protein [Pasteurellaceae bacterium]